MKIVLASAPMFNNYINNIVTLENFIKDNNTADLIVFGEAFLHGFDGLTWDYKKDKDIAISIKGEIINNIRYIAKQNNIAVSFGFYEKNFDVVYSSNIFIDKNGDILDIYHRVSHTWTVKNASKEYSTGDDFHTFKFMDKSIVVAICGDLWFDKNIDRINELESDLVLWPLYIDYSIDEWEGGAKMEYAEQVSRIYSQVLLVNSYMKEVDGAKGGAYLFNKGKIINCLPLGKVGCLHINC